MDKITAMEAKREELIQGLAGIKRMRRGSVVEQYYEVEHRDGTVARQGPYYLYSYKEGGKTVSRRLSGPPEAQRYREEIAQFRQFERLSAELVEVGQRLCEVAAEAEDAGGVREKKLRKRSRKRRPKRSVG